MHTLVENLNQILRNQRKCVGKCFEKDGVVTEKSQDSGLSEAADLCSFSKYPPCTFWQGKAYLLISVYVYIVSLYQFW